jgi:hypothetical protein
MANVVKIIKGATKAKKTFTKGKDKAIMRASQTYDSNTKGLGLVKGSNKKTAKAAKKVGDFDTVIKKHPLIRNAGELASEGKYRANRGKSVPIKKKK